MDSSIALAIMAKAKRVFERERTFLSFPLSPIAYTADQLDFFSESGSAAEQNRMISEYSRLVNLIPSGVEWPPEEERYLWDIYNNILNEAKVASAIRTPEQESEYEEAINFLYKTDENSLRVDSAAVEAYKQYRDAWIVAQENYNNKEIEAEVTDDAAVKQQWEKIYEPAYREAVVAAENEWSTKGFRAEVEEARRISKTLQGRSPKKTWQEWSNRFDIELDLKTDIDDYPYMVSGYFPENAVDENSWSSFSLSAAETQSLVDEAPPELKRRLMPNENDLDIESLSFEYSSAGVTRPWLVPDVFSSRFWKFYDSSKRLSDGNEIPSGLCPAYVVGIVFARNIELKAREKTHASKSLTGHLPANKPISLGFANLALAQTEQEKRTIKFVTNKETRNQAMTSRPKFNVAALAATRNMMKSTNHLSATRTHSNTAALRAHASLKRMMVSRYPQTPLAKGQLSGLRPIVASRITGLSAGPKHMATKLTNTDTSEQQSSSLSNEIYVMAFICKRIPKCPDPDPELDWGNA